MKKISDNIYESDDGKLFVRLSDSYIMGNLINLGDSDSINNYTEQSYSDSEIEAFNRKWGGIPKLDSNINVNLFHNSDTTVDIFVTAPDLATGTILVMDSDNNSYQGVLQNSGCTISMQPFDFSSDNYNKTIYVLYAGNDTYNGSTNIIKNQYKILIDLDDIEAPSEIYVGDTVSVNVYPSLYGTRLEDVYGDCTVEVLGFKFTSTINEEKASFELPGISAGTQTMIIKYMGDYYHAQQFTTHQIEVMKKPSQIQAASKDIIVGKRENITVTFSEGEDATGKCFCEINEVGYYGTVINAKAKITIDDLPSGLYTVEVHYSGDDKYMPSSTTTSFVVKDTKQ